MGAKLRIVMLGLSITSSWGNGHASTYRGLVRALGARGHEVLFLERNVPWYAAHRDLQEIPAARIELYSNLQELKDRFADDVCQADVVMVGSYVPEGVAVGSWVTTTARGITAFYDIDTPITLTKLACGDTEYLSPALVQRYMLYLSFTGGPTLEHLEKCYQAPRARPLYCAVDPELYYPEPCEEQWMLGYLGTYSPDRQPALEALLLEPARCWTPGHFVVAGPQFPRATAWPPNVQHIEHLPPGQHRTFYNAQRFTLNITRADMVRAGYSPSIRLFEAAACATPILSDYWQGLETFFAVGKEIVVVHAADETLHYLRELPEEERMAIGQRARTRVLAEHTAAHRAAELEAYICNLSS
jgi:spore maturation protein CgeB